VRRQRRWALHRHGETGRQSGADRLDEGLFAGPEPREQLGLRHRVLGFEHEPRLVRREIPPGQSHRRGSCRETLDVNAHRSRGRHGDHAKITRVREIDLDAARISAQVRLAVWPDPPGDLRRSDTDPLADDAVHGCVCDDVLAPILRREAGFGAPMLLRPEQRKQAVHGRVCRAAVDQPHFHRVRAVAHETEVSQF